MHSLLFAALNEKEFDLSVSYGKPDKHTVLNSLALANAKPVAEYPNFRFLGKWVSAISAMATAASATANPSHESDAQSQRIRCTVLQNTSSHTSLLLPALARIRLAAQMLFRAFVCFKAVP